MSCVMRFLLGIGFLAWVVRGQEPSCGSGMAWLNNSMSQNPCSVATSLEQVCSSTEGAFDPLGAGSNGYYGPDSNVLLCDCTTVLYNLISACTYCQGSNGWPTWSSWVSMCNSTVAATGFPYPIPSGAAVPHWAYATYDNITSKSWTAAVAQQLGDAPESKSALPTSSTPTSIGSPTSLSTSSSLTSKATSNATSTSSSTSVASHSGSSKTNTGAIAGGVVGGVVFIAVVIAGILLCLRKKAKTPRGGAEQSYMTTMPQTPQMSGPPPSAGFGQNYKLYDPSDPTTYPDSDFSSPPQRYSVVPSTAYTPTPHHPGLPEV